MTRASPPVSPLNLLIERNTMSRASTNLDEEHSEEENRAN